jgi:hypothetical protein
MKFPSYLACIRCLAATITLLPCGMRGSGGAWKRYKIDIQDIYNMDETGFQMGHSQEKGSTYKSTKYNYYRKYQLAS